MTEATSRLRVVKLGGSLFNWPEFPGRLREWLARQSPACNVLITGGGPFADVIRAADQCHGLGEEVSHQLCVQVLSVTAALTKHLLPEFSGPMPPERIEPACENQLILLDVPKLIEWDAAKSIRPLPASWHVTTDSIAARAAVLLHADELVVLKSTLPQHKSSFRELAEAGYLDSHFPICAKSINNLRMVNLRHVDFAELHYVLPPSKR